MTDPAARSSLAEQYLAQLPYPPYPVQEDALLAWYTCDQGVMVCAPTGTGKTLIAHAALFEALHTGATAYYTTPLIALTEQKFQEMQAAAIRWGFKAEDIGLVTGNRKVNPQARILIVVAEILLNRLLHGEEFDFGKVASVVMDEFHSFADLERGIVWELSLALLPKHVRLLLLSATVGNSGEFVAWLDRCHGRKVELIESRDRKVPLTYHWIADLLIGEQVVEMAKGDPQTRKTPALIFCFNRDECWSLAEQFKGLQLLGEDQRGRLHAEVNRLQWPEGVGPKMKQMLHRGVGVHHAGMLPKYRRVVEDLFERKLLALVLCTETLASGINLPARSVLLTSLVKGPFGKEKLIDPSTAHQIFGRAGRPQYDTEGHVFALAHEDDVKLLRWKEKFDQIPENTKDPNLIRAKKALKRKKPLRRDGVQYWTEGQFKLLQGAPPGKLYSKGQLPWRLLAYLLKISPEVNRLRAVLRKRLMDEPRLRASEKQLDQMLLTLERMKFVRLDPEPPKPDDPEAAAYQPRHAQSTEKLDQLLLFRSIHPLYASFLLEHLGIADREERIQALESVLEMPRPLLKHVRVPFPPDLPPGPLAATRLDNELIQRGLMASPVAPAGEEEEEQEDEEWKERPLVLAEKLWLYFESLHPEIADAKALPIWCAAELLRFGGNFNKYVQSRDLVKQEGIVFRHLLRLILLCGELAQVCPTGASFEDWKAELSDIAQRLTDSCRAVDPASTDEMIERAHAADVVEGEAVAAKPTPQPSKT